MKNPWIKLLLVAILSALCVWEIAVKEVRLGKDLKGGVSLIYAVSSPGGQAGEEVLAQVIDVLKQRVNPQGIFDISIQPQGSDRIEVVMPLPSSEVQALQKDAKEKAADFIAKTQISGAALDAALLGGTAASRFGKQNPVVVDLEAAWQQLQAAKSELEALTKNNAPSSEIGPVEDRVVAAELRVESLRASALSRTLDAARLNKVLGLSTEPQPLRGADGKVQKDEKGNVQFGPSPREIELAAIQTEFPMLTAELQSLVAAQDAYIARRSGLDDPEDLMRLLRGAGVLEFRIAVTPDAMGVNIDELRGELAKRGPRAAEPGVARWFPLNSLSQWYEKPDALEALRADPVTYFASNYNLVAGQFGGEIYVLLHDSDTRSMTHDGGAPWALTRAGRTVDQRLGSAAVSFELDPVGGERMGALTTPNVGMPMAIVLDDQVYSAPTLNDRITTNGIITGRFSDADISYLVRVLTAGSLQAKVSPDPISMAILGPSIGADNFAKGKEAVLISVLITCLVMLFYYFLAGVVADVALAVNTLLIFGIMAFIDGMFTLPGLAGVALSIAMAVDANVLIYERIREELQQGNPLKVAIATAYRRAFSAIIDGNVTNLIVCIVLYKVGATEVKGFALTMSIGVITTLFTGLWVTRAMFDGMTGLGLKSLPMLPTVVPAIGRVLTPNVDWIKLRPALLAFSGFLFVAAIASVFIRGNDIFETEFRGGVTMSLTTRVAKPGETAVENGRLGYTRAAFEERVRALGERNADDIVVSQLASANVLTVGETDAAGLGSQFQIRVGNPPDPPEGFDETRITRDVVEAVTREFANDLDVRLPLVFTGHESREHAAFSKPVEKALVGSSIGRPDVAQEPAAEFRGGVAIVIDAIEPPVTTTDVIERINRMRAQPDWSSTGGRPTKVFGLDPVDPAAPQGLQRAVAVLVSDSELNSFEVDLEVWDRDLAAQEWQLVRQALTQQASLDQVSSFSPIVAENLAATAVVAVILSLIGMLAYIWVRFGSFRFSTAAVVSLTFNVVICLGFLAISIPLAKTGLGPALFIEEYRIDLNVVSGLLTIIGYSINDTVVILDRIRENRGKRTWISRDTVNLSINQTFSRTILTGGSTLATAVVLIVLGGTGIRPFAFTFMIGLIAGTFSSVAIAATLVYSRREEEAERSKAAIAPVSARPQTV
jgi:SecD/SecF fusion protein